MSEADEVAEQARVLSERLRAQGADYWAIVEALHRHHHQAARACQDDRPELAIAHLREVEAAQRRIATTATAGGEGLMYMSELYEIMGERARLHERLAAADPSHAAQALAIWEEIVRDPNGQGRWAEPELMRARAKR